MPTIKQKRVAKLIIENSDLVKPLTDIEILKRSNYSISTSETKSTRIIGSEGVQQALAESGFTEENAKKVVESIMLNEETDPSARLKATDQVFKVHGSYAPDKNININMDVQTIDPTDPEILNALKVIQEKQENE